MKHVAFRLVRRGLLIAFWTITIFFTVLLVRAFDARRGPDLKPWHTARLREEFSNWDARKCKNLAEYLSLEERLFAEMDRKVAQKLAPEDRITVNRYNAATPAATNWNRTIEIVPDEIRGGVLMLHGMTDSPYSMKHLADLYRRHGFYVLALRLPGHGTIPSGLLYADWHDWLAATELGARHVKERIGPGKPFHIVGYSNGGALALKYALDAAQDGHARGANRMILLSPMIGVSRAASLSRFISLIGEIPFFEKSRWLDNMTEYIPYKYNSFAAKAGFQSHLLSTSIRAQVTRLAKRGALTNLPPILAFQSIVDATVSTRAVVDGLFEYLPGKDNELVVFNVNKASGIRPFIKESDLDYAQSLFKDRARRYRLSVVSNRDANSPRVAEYTAASSEDTPEKRDLDLAWSGDVYSLSHMALPMPVDDPVYGIKGTIGGLAPRGEKGVLSVPISQFMRLTCNPFYPYVEDKITVWIGSDF